MADEMYTLKEFVPDFRHALKGPLAVIKEANAIVLEGLLGPINDKQRSSLEAIARNADRMVTLINDGFLCQSFVTNTVDVHRVTCDMCVLVAEVVGELMPYADHCGVALVSDMPDAPGICMCDKSLMRFALRQLVLNALQFTQKGRVVVSVKVMNGTVDVAIADTGSGLDKSGIERSLMPFKQLEKTDRTLPVCNVGLGLPIVKEILVRHDAVLVIDGEKGKGTIVSFSLRLHGA